MVQIGTTNDPISAPGLSELLPKITQASRDQFWNVYQEFDWPEVWDERQYAMSPELVSLYGTTFWDKLTETQIKKLSLYELANFFSLTLQGERPLVAGISDRLYGKRLDAPSTEYMHHFLDEENKHMIMFGMFCNQYIGKVYPEKKMVLDRQYKNKLEEEIVFFTKVMVVEEVGDFYNVKMMLDNAIHPLVKKINAVHHRDESRHLGFGRLHLNALCEQGLPQMSIEMRQGFSDWLAAYLKSSLHDFYNPTMYNDAGLKEVLGMSGYEIREAVLGDPVTQVFRQKATKKLVNYFLKTGLLLESPQL